MKALIIRGLDDKTYEAVRKMSKKEHTSMNKFIVDLLKRASGQLKGRKINHDFDEFFGSWTKEDRKHFLKNTKDLSKIDKEMWS